MRRVEIDPNGTIWLEKRTESWVLNTPWDIVTIDSVELLPKLAEALRYALMRHEAERDDSRQFLGRIHEAVVTGDPADDDYFEGAS